MAVPKNPIGFIRGSVKLRPTILEVLPSWGEIVDTLIKKFFSSTNQITGKVIELTPIPQSASSSIQVLISVGIVALGIWALKKLQKPIVGLGIIAAGIIFFMGVFF